MGDRIDSRTTRSFAIAAGATRWALAASTARRLLLACDARTVTWAAVLAAGIVVAIGVPLAAALNIWTDEAFTLHTTGAGAGYAWAQAIGFEAQPPLYFVLEAVWRSWNESSVAFARLPSVGFAAAAVAVIVVAANRIAPRIPPLVVALATAVNPLFIWAAVEMRVYALVLLIGAVLTVTFFEAFLASHPSRRALIWYAIFAVGGLYTQYYIGFVLAAHCITLVVLRRRGLRAFAVIAAGVGVAFAPFLPVALVHVGASGDVVAPVTPGESIHQTLNAIFAFVFPHDPGWTGWRKLAGFGLAAVAMIAVFALGGPVRVSEPARAFAGQWFISLVVFSAAFAIAGAPLDFLRHLVIVAPASLLAALVFMSGLTRRRGLAGGLAIAVFALFAATQLWEQYHPPTAKRGEWAAVAAMLTADDRSTPIAVFPAELALPLGVYLPGATIPIPKPMPFSLDYVAATTLRSEADVARVLDPVHARSQRLWLVTLAACDDPQLAHFRYNCPALDAYLDRSYLEVRSVVFRGSLARLYVRLPQVPIESHDRRLPHEGR